MGGDIRLLRTDHRDIPDFHLVLPQSKLCGSLHSKISRSSWHLRNIQVVQQYERAVIFRLGRLLKGGARGPGLFFVIPCIDSYSKIDLRSVTFDVPPQEVSRLR